VQRSGKGEMTNMGIEEVGDMHRTNCWVHRERGVRDVFKWSYIQL